MLMNGELHEKCAVVGVSLEDPADHAAQIVRPVLADLQHRGRDATGIASGGESLELLTYRNRGSVEGVLTESKVEALQGPTSIGHNRYSTNGNPESHLQPFVSPYSRIATAHNGNLPTTTLLEHDLTGSGVNLAHYNDSEILGIALNDRMQRLRKSLPDAFEDLFPRIVGAFSFVAMHDDLLIASRDSKGIRPLELGKHPNGTVVASETCGLNSVGATHVRSVLPGEMVVIKDGQIVEQRQLAPSDPKFCIFEYVYFGRPDSVFNGQLVYDVRTNLGKQLALAHPPGSDNSNSIIVPVPETSYPMADGYAQTTGLPMLHAIHKNQLVTRSFMMKTQHERDAAVRSKHNVMPVVKGKDVILIDDSIVRLTTIPVVVNQVRELGARSVSVLVGSAPVRFPDFYGISMPDQEKLAAATMTQEEMRKQIGCDYLGYLSISAMVKATNTPADTLNLSPFNGEYPIDIGAHKKTIRRPVETVYMD